MSLRDFGVYAPLNEFNPLCLDGSKCRICGCAFSSGSRVALKAFETPEQAGSLTVSAMPVCGTCAMRGVVVRTPKGLRVVDRIKDGDASPYAVIDVEFLLGESTRKKKSEREVWE